MLALMPCLDPSSPFGWGVLLFAFCNSGQPPASHHIAAGDYQAFRSTLVVQKKSRFGESDAIFLKKTKYLEPMHLNTATRCPRKRPKKNASHGKEAGEGNGGRKEKKSKVEANASVELLSSFRLMQK